MPRRSVSIVYMLLYVFIFYALLVGASVVIAIYHISAGI